LRIVFPVGREKDFCGGAKDSGRDDGSQFPDSEVGGGCY
jgi:hypothetical protein